MHIRILGKVLNIKLYPFDQAKCIIFFRCFLSSSNVGISHPGTYNLNASGSDPYKGSNRLWTGILDRETLAGLHECMVNTMSGP